MVEQEICEECRRPKATEEDWDRYEEDEGEHLCWGDPFACMQIAEELKAEGKDPISRVEALEKAIRDVLCDDVPCSRCDHLRAALESVDEEASDGQ